MPLLARSALVALLASAWLPASAAATIVVERGARIVAVASDGRERTVTVGHEPAISPDGRRIAFYRGRQSRGYDLRVVPVGGGRSRILARRIHTSAPEPPAPMWSPDGRRVVPSGNRLIVATLDGRTRRYAPRVLGDVFGVAFSPDGERLAYSNGDLELVATRMLDLRTGRRQLLRRAGAGAWSRFGFAYPTFTREGDPRTGLAPQGHVRWRRPDGRTRAVAPLAFPIAWTPEGRLLVERYDETLGFLDPRHRTYQRLPRLPLSDSIVAISRDGRRALATRTNETRAAIEVDLLTGATQVRVDDLSGEVNQPSWDE